ncbi:PadR family transcriptional regulator [Aurantiacibacter sp. D1-12]|uniref:PadR family transcriptional regulator n=1 Tax=Aurantiacibacter sp. D1-12 TaxID=2993658 RepID=UPI00237CEA25|nr:PadR family transcriptional regulator [Aurantiacibacter sp. D1-12]MDE1466123.1 PadR family transcriptional regulator [Aurantiacibacter sp. D1-12]
MAKKPAKGAKATKARKATKATKATRTRKTTRRTAKPKEEIIEPEDMEPVEDAAASDDDDIEVEVEVEVEIDDEDDDEQAERRRRRKNFKRQFKREFKREFNTDDIFGPDGIFGRGGPFGGNNPFNATGIFGPGGLFTLGGNRNRGGRRHGHGGPGRKRERMFGPGELRLVLLAMLAEEPRHGYELIKALEEMTGGAYSPSPGVIYPTLQMLGDEGVIEEKESEDARKLYQATEAGLDELEDRADDVDELWERLGRKAERARPTGSADVFRSLGNLATVLTNKASRGDLKDVQKDQVIDLIDALARKIERL